MSTFKSFLKKSKEPMCEGCCDKPRSECDCPASCDCTCPRKKGKNKKSFREYHTHGRDPAEHDFD